MGRKRKEHRGPRLQWSRGVRWSAGDDIVQLMAWVERCGPHERMFNRTVLGHLRRTCGKEYTLAQVHDKLGREWGTWGALDFTEYSLAELLRRGVRRAFTRRKEYEFQLVEAALEEINLSTSRRPPVRLSVDTSHSPSRYSLRSSTASRGPSVASCHPLSVPSSPQPPGGITRAIVSPARRAIQFQESGRPHRIAPARSTPASSDFSAITVARLPRDAVRDIKPEPVKRTHLHHVKQWSSSTGSSLTDASSSRGVATPVNKSSEEKATRQTARLRVALATKNQELLRERRQIFSLRRQIAALREESESRLRAERAAHANWSKLHYQASLQQNIDKLNRVLEERSAQKANCNRLDRGRGLQKESFHPDNALKFLAGLIFQACSQAFPLSDSAATSIQALLKGKQQINGNPRSWGRKIATFPFDELRIWPQDDVHGSEFKEHVFRALISAVICDEVFESDLVQELGLDSPFLATYRNQVLTKHGENASRELDLLALRELSEQENFSEVLLQKRSEELAAYISDSLLPASDKSDDLQQLTDAAPVAAPQEPQQALTTEAFAQVLQKAVLEALEMHVQFFLSCGRYQFIWPPPGKFFDSSTMTADGLGDRTASEQRVRLCLYPALYKYDANVGEERNSLNQCFVRAEMQNSALRPPGSRLLSKAIVLLAD